MFFRLVSWVMAALLFTAAVLQYNDPDPVQWMAIYGVAALLSLVHERMTSGRIAAPAIVLVAALAWAGAIVKAMHGEVAARELFGSMDPNRPQIEQAREVIGLLIVAAWMALLTIRSWTRRS